MKNEIIKEDILDIGDMIYEINGKEVMLDSDLAKLYHVETKRINEAVKNNPKKFPTRFSWNLTINETQEISRSKISTLNTAFQTTTSLPNINAFTTGCSSRGFSNLLIAHNFFPASLLDAPQWYVHSVGKP